MLTYLLKMGQKSQLEPVYLMLNSDRIVGLGQLL